ncbi:MAG TPA: S9 family peptidase [Thermoanaerobaculia bacterium]
MKRLALLLLLALPLLGEKKALTLEALFDPKNAVRFGGAVQRGFEWIDDTTFVWPYTDADGTVVEWRIFDVATGKARPLFDKQKLQRALEAAGLTEEVAKSTLQARALNFDAKKSAIVIEAAEDLFAYSLRSGSVSRLTSAPGKEEVATFSPDGQKVAFVRDNDLYVVDLQGRERRLTTGGTEELLNGKIDYVYQEEIYGRGNFKGYWWSPDSSRIAFLHSDERLVPTYTIVDELDRHPGVNTFKYPKAGDPNPRVSLKLVPSGGGPVVDVDHDPYTGGEFLIVGVTWAPDSKSVTYQVQNREQTWLDLVSVNTSGAGKTLFRETTKAWVDPLGEPTWLEDGSFLWQSERTGWRHLYHYKSDGTLIRQVTSGEWEVRDVAGVDGQTVYFSATERSAIGGDTYRINLDGTSLKRLSQAEGTHAATFNPKLTHYVDKWSDIRTPDQIRVYRNDGREVSVVDANPVNLDYDIPNAEFMQVKTRDGISLDAILIKPTNFDPTKKYPVYQMLYAGPHAPKVGNRWGGQGLQSLLFLQFIAQQGFIGWVCDNRTASGKGAVSAWPAYKNLGEIELRDIEDGVSWLKSQPWVDGDRIGLFGWSYGGFMVAYALTHSTSFAAGIAGAPVTDWRNYDSVYTERVMLMPQNNREGYDKSSALLAAKNLHGHLLLLHGTTDDNVHPQNTIQFANELQQAGIPFEMMLYPRTRHSVVNKKTTLHIQKTVLDFLKRRLQP